MNPWVFRSFVVFEVVVLVFQATIAVRAPQAFNVFLMAAQAAMLFIVLWFNSILGAYHQKVLVETAVSENQAKMSSLILAKMFASEHAEIHH